MVVGTASRDRWLSSSFCSEHISACQALWQKEGCPPPCPTPVQGGKAPRSMKGPEREAHGQGGEGKMMWF